MKEGKTKPRAVVWDLDGTLSDDRARAHFVEVQQGKGRDWKSYFDAIDKDPPIAASMEVLRAMHAAGNRVVFLTGRPEYTRRKTEKWLKANGLTEYDRLLMRPPGEYRPAGRFKAEVVERLRDEYELVCAFEDRTDVAHALRGAGLPVFLYGAGALAAAESLEAEDSSRRPAAAQKSLFDEEEPGEEGEGERTPSREKKRPAARKPPATKSASRARPSRARKAADRGKARAAKSGLGRAPGGGKGGKGKKT
jgi:beta-phosphoglucomutase-like phosphatase (HAD superfamily)